MKVKTDLRYLRDSWNNDIAHGLDELEQLRYRSNLLGSDLRITNFGGGNTSSKVFWPDPLTGAETAVLLIKGSGGDLGSIKAEGFAALSLDKIHYLARDYRVSEYEDEMVDLYPLCRFGLNVVSTSIDTPIHAFLPFRHIDRRARSQGIHGILI